MSLPPSFLEELRARVPLSDIVGRKVTWDRRKSNPAKGDFWAPCPFHQEKTPSFHVDDRKGFYYCFGCHAKGDAISFLKEQENVSFIEAVELMAQAAGMEMPAETRDPRAAEKRDRDARLVEVMEEAVRFFGRSFRAAAGQGAREYATGRGLKEDALKRFEIGYAPDARTALTSHFREKGQLAEAVAAGLVIEPDDGGAPYDRFRGRLIFPIRDPRGRCIAFGGRAMDPGARAKYLNSPETALFHKGRTLYNHGPAREAAGKAGTVIVAEGYLDVIALAMAGFGHAVAPLGTAITEEQLQLLWRMAPEPVIALDGDEAGLRAAYRLIDLALPMLAPGRTLRFCLMPEGQDPDDLIRAEGPEAVRRALEASVPLDAMLWRRETEAKVLDTPERRAAFDADLKAALGRIGDEGVRAHYTAAFRERRRELFAPPPRDKGGYAPRNGGGPAAPGRGRGRWRAPEGPSMGTRASEIARPGGSARADARLREATILLVALVNPAAMEGCETELGEMHCTDAEMGRLRDAILSALADLGPVEPQALAEHVRAAAGVDPLAELRRVPAAAAHPFAGRGGDAESVAALLRHDIAVHETKLERQAEAGALDQFNALKPGAEEVDSGAWNDPDAWSWRLRRALEAQEEAARRSFEEVDDSPRESEIRKMLAERVFERRRR